MLKRIRQYIFAIRYRNAIKRADKLAQAFKLRYYVIVVNRKIQVVPKQTIKELIRRGRFRKGVTIETIEKKALYITQ